MLLDRMEVKVKTMLRVKKVEDVTLLDGQHSRHSDLCNLSSQVYHAAENL